MNATEAPNPAAARRIERPGSIDAARAACRRIAPLWPLQNFVAVNPFIGLIDRTFLDACALVGRIAPGGMQMPPTFYRAKYESGSILDADLEAALVQARKTLGDPWSEALAPLDVEKLLGKLTEPPAPASEGKVLTIAEAVDLAYGTRWTAAVVDAIAHFCAEYFDAGQSAWRLPWRALPLYAAWREAAAIDANSDLLGLRGFRRRVGALPPEAETAIAQSLDQLGVSAEEAEDFLYKQIVSIRGWAGYVQYRVRGNGMHGRSDDSLLQLLAIRLAYDAALLAQFDGPVFRAFWPAKAESAASDSSKVLAAFLWQVAAEHAWQRQLTGKLRAAKAAGAPPLSNRPALQAVFCIDVRSEILRRALESAHPGIETSGFAGFFGLPIEYIPFGQHKGSSQCPVLLKPQLSVREGLRHAGSREEHAALRRQRLGKRLTYSWSSFKTSAISCFSFVDTAGLAFAAKLFRDAFIRRAKDHARRQTHGPRLAGDADATGITLSQRVELAASALRNMGLTKNFARLVLLCGHGSETANNPYGSGLDCGACGGHSGEANARLGALILNDPMVRAALENRGIPIPADTHFLAGLHNTTTDHVALFDLDEAPSTHREDIAGLHAWLGAAANTARRERAASLGLDAADPALDRKIIARSDDWAQVRPEWGACRQRRLHCRATPEDKGSGPRRAGLPA